MVSQGKPTKSILGVPQETTSHPYGSPPIRRSIGDSPESRRRQSLPRWQSQRPGQLESKARKEHRCNHPPPTALYFSCSKSQVTKKQWLGGCIHASPSQKQWLWGGKDTTKKRCQTRWRDPRQCNRIHLIGLRNSSLIIFGSGLSAGSD